MRSTDELYHDLHFRTRLEAAARRERARVIGSLFAGLFKSRPVVRRPSPHAHLVRPC